VTFGAREKRGLAGWHRTAKGEVPMAKARKRKPVAVEVKWVKDWTVVAYLIVIDKAISKLGDLVKVRPSDRFQEVVAKFVGNYLTKGSMPPNEIMSPILNLADDAMSGRQMTVRAGDYITLQNYIRQM
jgi:hypothetical protein